MKKIKQKYFIKDKKIDKEIFAKDKKAVSQIISWVLLIGLTVTIAIFITTWTIKQTKETTEKTTELVIGDVRCSSVALNAVLDCSTGKLKISNKGDLTINGIIVRKYLPEKTSPTIEDNPTEIKPQETINLNINLNYNKIEIIPKIKIDSKKIGCSEKIVILTEEELIC